MLCTEEASEEFAQMRKRSKMKIIIQLLHSKLWLPKGPQKLFTLRTVTKRTYSIIHVPEESRMQFLMSFLGSRI